MRCAVDEIGINSVNPSIIPRKAALKMSTKLGIYFLDGTSDPNRTDTSQGTIDFESIASTNSATEAQRKIENQIKILRAAL